MSQFYKVKKEKNYSEAIFVKLTLIDNFLELKTPIHRFRNLNETQEGQKKSILKYIIMKLQNIKDESKIKKKQLEGIGMTQ